MESAAADRRLFWVTAVAILAADLVTKFLAESMLTYRPVQIVGEWVQLRLVFNQCAAFGVCIGGIYSRWVFLALALAALTILGGMVRRTPSGDRPRLLALALLCAGAAGNVIDRVRSSQGVVDFLDVGIGPRRWPTFNVADSAITVGAVLLAVSLWLEGRAHQAGRAKEARAAQQ